MVPHYSGMAGAVMKHLIEFLKNLYSNNDKQSHFLIIVFKE